MPDIEQQILAEFTEIVNIISSEVMANTVTPAFREEVEHWTFKAQEKINNLEKLFQENVLILNNMIRKTSQSLENALLALANNRVEIRELFRQTERLEQSLKNLSETATLPDKLTEISLNIKKFSVLTAQIEQRTNEYQRVLMQNQKELYSIKQVFLQIEEQLLYENKKSNEKLIEAAEKLRACYAEFVNEMNQKEQNVKKALSETERQLALQITKLMEINEIVKSLFENNFNLLKAEINTLVIELADLKTQFIRCNEQDINELKIIKTKQNDMLKKLDVLTIAVFILGTAAVTLLVWLLFL